MSCWNSNFLVHNRYKKRKELPWNCLTSPQRQVSPEMNLSDPPTLLLNPKQCLFPYFSPGPRFLFSRYCRALVQPPLSIWNESKYRRTCHLKQAFFNYLIFVINEDDKSNCWFTLILKDDKLCITLA